MENCELSDTQKKQLLGVFCVSCIVLTGLLMWYYWPPQTFTVEVKGVNSYYLYSCSREYQVKVFEAMKRSNFVWIRIFINKYQDEGYPGECGGTEDAEYPLGVFNVATIQRINDFLLLAKQYSVKVVLVLHDRWSLGCWRSDAYVQAFNLSVASIWGSSCPTANKFYVTEEIRTAFKNRLRYLLNVPIENTTWKAFDAIGMFEVQNEPQYGSLVPSLDWDCTMAFYLKQFTSIRVSNGGSLVPVVCDSIDVHAIHDYNSILSYIAQWTLQRSFGKTLVLEEFTYDSKKIKWSNEHSTPWMLWNVDERNTSTSISVTQLGNL